MVMYDTSTPPASVSGTLSLGLLGCRRGSHRSARRYCHSMDLTGQKDLSTQNVAALFEPFPDTIVCLGDYYITTTGTG